MSGVSSRPSAGGAEHPAPLSDSVTASANRCWIRWRLDWQTGLNNLASLSRLARLPGGLVSSRNHDVLLAHYRTRFLSARLGVMLMFLGIATIAWIPIDAVLFYGNWDVVLPLATGRLVTAGAFMAIGSAQVSSSCQQQPIAALTLTIIVGIAFFFFTHVLVGHRDDSVVMSAGHAQYMLMPIALAVGISVFPLTLIEAVALAALPLIAFLVETLLFDGGLVWMYPALAALLMCLIMLTTAICSMSQLALLKELHGKSAIDPLTGAVSRRAAIDLLNILFEQSSRAQRPLALAMLDLDWFKAVNDLHGHEAGDQLLQEVVGRIKQRLRRQDVIIRWGGEELLAVLPDTTAAEAAGIVSMLCRGGLARRPDGSIQTASAGLAERDCDGARHWQELIEMADLRMYVGKDLGRDHLCGPAEFSMQLSVAWPAGALPAGDSPLCHSVPCTRVA
jgi:diguanylate cyclase (GGDEF)-like protein